MSELRQIVKAIAGGWPGLLLFVLVVVIAFTMEGK